MKQTPSIEQLIEELTTFVHHGEALIAALGNDADGDVHEAKKRAQEFVATAKERLAQLQGYLASGADMAVDTAEAYVRDNPWKTITLAACIGFLLGALMSRPRSP